MILVLPVLTGRHTFKLFWPVHSTFHFMSVSKGGLLETMSKTNKKHQEHVLFLKSISPSIQQNNMASLFSLLGRFLPRQGLTILWDRFWILDCVCNEMWQYSEHFLLFGRFGYLLLQSRHVLPGDDARLTRTMMQAFISPEILRQWISFVKT